jgi:hypothetical protein
MSKELKDSAEFLAVNATGLGISWATLDDNLRTFILLCTAAYAVMKLIKGYFEIMEKRKNKK